MRRIMNYSSESYDEKDLTGKIIRTIKSLSEDNVELFSKIEENQDEIQQLKRDIRTFKMENRELKSQTDTQKSEINTLKERLNMVCAWIELTEKKA